MNIEVLGRIRPPSRGKEKSPAFTVNNNTVRVTDGVSASFSKLYNEETSNQDIYDDCMAHMVDLFLAGYNLSFICLGEPHSGRSFTLFGGGGSGQLGMVSLAVQALVERIKQNTDESTVTIDLRMYEVYSEVIRDLLNRTTQPGELGCTAQDWYHVKNVKKHRLEHEQEALDAITNGWKQMSGTHTTGTQSTLIVQLEATVVKKQFGYPHRSSFTLVDLPAFEIFRSSGTEARRGNGPPVDKSVAALQRLVSDLSKQQDLSQDIDSSASKLTCLLQDSFGGNAKTKLMVHLKADSSREKMTSLLQFSSQLSQVKNFFILNDAASQGLLTRWRAKVLSLQRQLGAQALQAPGMGAKAELSSREEEISKLRMENGYLARKLDRLQNQFSDVAAAKEDLSGRLIASEEERLKASRALVDFKIENSRQLDSLVQENFELKNKLMSYEGQLLQEQSERRRAVDNISRTQHQYHGLELESRDMVGRFSELQASYEALMKKHDSEVKRNQELGLELLNLLNAEVTLIKQRGNLASAAGTGDLGKIRDIALGLTAERDKVVPSLGEVLSGERSTLQEVDKMKSIYDQQQDLLQAQIQELNASAQRSKQEALTAQRKVVQQEVELMMKRDEVKEMEREVNNLNLQIKATNEELRRRLQKYLDDIADFVEQQSEMPNAGQILKGTVDQITADMKKTYQNREKQLSNAARSYRQQAQKVAKRHEQLLVAYRVLRNRVKDWPELEEAQGEEELSLSDADLESSNRQELNKLGSALESLKAELEKSKNDSEKNMSLGVLKKQFQEQQAETERERASLLASNALLEEQLAEYSEYIKKEVPRYKDEIQRLRLKLGITDPYMPPRHSNRGRTYPEFWRD